MDRMLHNLLGFDGRINRVTWLVYFLALAAAESAAANLLAGVLGGNAPVAGSNPLEAYFADRAGFTAALIFLWPSLVIDVKRWHDIGGSGWIALIAYAPAFAMFLVEELKRAGAIPATPVPSALFSAMAFVFLIYIMLLGARKGRAAANRFGQASGAGLGRA